jgi:transcriptional regulator of arginine metabolism
MTGANVRRETVARLLRSRRIGTQEELLAALEAEGLQATQATLSRDLARLGARRAARPEGGTFYELPDGAGDDGALRVRTLVTSITTNTSIAVIRTLPGSAPAVARAIDLAGLPEVLGTIAGDDTIFVAPAEDVRPRRLAERLRSVLAR